MNSLTRISRTEKAILFAVAIVAASFFSTTHVFAGGGPSGGGGCGCGSTSTYNNGSVCGNMTSYNPQTHMFDHYAGPSSGVSPTQNHGGGGPSNNPPNNPINNPPPSVIGQYIATPCLTAACTDLKDTFVPPNGQPVGTNGDNAFGDASLNANYAAAKRAGPEFCKTGQCLDIKANPALIKNGATSLISWSYIYANSCTVTGPGINVTPSGVSGGFGEGAGGVGYGSGSQKTPALVNQSIYTLTCSMQTGGTQSVHATVNIVPEFQEI